MGVFTGWIPTISVKAVKGTQRTNPDQWPGLILFSFTIGLLHLSWQSDTRFSFKHVNNESYYGMKTVSAGNTADEKSSMFLLMRMRWLPLAGAFRQ